MKTHNTKISIIIPMYNVEKYLRRCLDSVKNQTFQDWMAICIDDGSPDNSGKIAEEYAKKDKRFIVIHKENGGVSDARNVGMKYVKCGYVLFLDADDCIHPQALEIAYNLAEQKNADVVSFKYIINNPSTDMPEWFNIKYNIKNIKTKYTKNLLKFATNMDKGNKSWRVEQSFVWDELYKYDFIKNIHFIKGCTLYEDVIFWSSVLFRKPKTVIIKLPLYSYTENPKSALHTVNHIKNCNNTLMVVEHAFSDKKKKELSWLNHYRWRKHFLWIFIPRIYSSLKRIEDKDAFAKAVKKTNILKSKGMFDNPPDFHAWRKRRRLFKFLEKLDS